MQLADIREGEQVQILDIDNGNRFETYAITGGQGDVCLNGAAARRVQPGDKIIILTYADYEEAELAEWTPQVVHVDTANRAVPEHVAKELAQREAPGPLRYREVVAELEADGGLTEPAVN